MFAIKYLVGGFVVRAKVGDHGQVEGRGHLGLVDTRLLRPYKGTDIPPPEGSRGQNALRFVAVRLCRLETGAFN